MHASSETLKSGSSYVHSSSEPNSIFKHTKSLTTDLADCTLCVGVWVGGCNRTKQFKEQRPFSPSLHATA